MASNGIPLHCNICPKKPNFSDVSHLLTHIASKGHLSNYYKIKVRSSQEDASRRLIETYDQWYAQWNVEQLMSDRMSQKDKRRMRTRPAGRVPPGPKHNDSIPRPARSRAPGSNLLDPRLSEQQTIKKEHSMTPIPPPMPGPTLRRRPINPHLQYWPTESRASSYSQTNPDYDTSSEYSDPNERFRIRYTVEDSCAVEDDPLDTVPDNRMATSESTKLKGVYWPGMDLFDSATPEMRRKRNQKKDSSVIEQLELNSQEVEPTEIIFTPNGSFKKQRRISSSVYDDEESSPIKAESPHGAARPPLADVDANSHRSRQFGRPPPFPFLTRNQYDNERSRSSHAHGYGEPAPKRKREFEVFQDDEVSFAQPAGLSYLTAGFNPQRSPSPAPGFTLYKPFNDPFQYENKENSIHGFHQLGYGSHHPHHTAVYQYHTYPYGLAQEQPTLAYHSHLYGNHSAYQQQQQNIDDDDERTITAPPSPNTS